MIWNNYFIITVIISSAFILSSCNIINKAKDKDSVKKIQSDSKASIPEADSDQPSKSIVPPSFGETPRYRGGINPINPAGPGTSAY